jgi:hypothetical protein
MSLGLALVVCTALFLFFTNALFRKTVVGLVVLVVVVGGTLLGWYEYVSLPRQEAERRQALAAAQERIGNEEAALAKSRDANGLMDDRWLFLSTDIKHRRYFLDTQTVQAEAGGVLAWVRRTPCPSFFAAVDSSSCPSYENEETTRMWFSCAARLLNANTKNVLSERTAPQPNTMDELILNWIQESRFCAEVKAQLAAKARPVVPETHPASESGVPVTASPDAGTNGVRTEDGRYAYVATSGLSKVMVKTSRVLSEEEHRGLINRVKVQCPSSWAYSHCDGKLPDGATWASQPYLD